jgi:hypothetical protein
MYRAVKEHVPAAKAAPLVALNVRDKSRTYLRDNSKRRNRNPIAIGNPL